MKKLNIVSVLLLFALVVTIVISVNMYSNLKDEKAMVEQELKEYSDSVLMNHEVFQQTENYLAALMEGGASDYLSERYLEEVQRMEELEDNHGHSHAKLENMEIYNISVDPQSEEEFIVYAIYLAQLGGIGEEEVEEHQYRSMIFTTKFTFVEEGGEYKVDSSELKPIETSESFFEDMMR